MHFLGFRLEWVGRKPLGNLRQTQEHVIDCERRLNLLEKHGTKVTGERIKKLAMDDDIADVLAGSTPMIDQGGLS